MILRIGRWGDDVEIESPATWRDQSLAGQLQTVRVTGDIVAGTLAEMQAARTELLEQVGATIAATDSQDSTRDGFYRLLDADLDLVTLIDVGYVTWRATLERIGSSGQTEFQSLITAAVMANDHGLIASELAAFHAPPIGHVAYRTNASAFPTARQRVTADSATAMDWYDGIDITGDPSWSIEPGNYYLGAARIYVSGRLRTGLDVPNDPADWELSNGLIKITPGTTTGASNGRINVATYNGTTWDTALSYSIWYDATTEIPGWNYISVLSNEPDEVRFRLVRDANDTEGSRAHTLDLALKRGSRYLWAKYSWNGDVQDIQVGRTTTDAAAAITVTGQTSSPGIVDSVATDSNKYVIISPRTHTQDLTNGKVTRAASTIMPFAIGAEVGASPGAGNLAADLVKQYLLHVSENVRAVRR